LDKHWTVVVAFYQLFHLHDYLKVFNNEHELPLSAMNEGAGKLFQRMHNEGVITQSLSMESYYEKLCVMDEAGDDVTDDEVTHDTVLRLTEARS
jgi:hypothetical protein